jgi:hypothetical protein
MDKIWIINDESRKKKKFYVYKTETDLINSLSDGYEVNVLEYELKSLHKSSEILKERERDIQLRTVLGELSEEESNIQKFITLYEQLAPEGKTYQKRIWDPNTKKMTVINTSKKKEILESLKKGDKKRITRILKEKKEYFITGVSNSVEWYLAILRINNFRDHIYKYIWNNDKKKYVSGDCDPIIIKNFKLAKEELKLLRKKKINRPFN